MYVFTLKSPKNTSPITEERKFSDTLKGEIFAGKNFRLGFNFAGEQEYYFIIAIVHVFSVLININVNTGRLKSL